VLGLWVSTGLGCVHVGSYVGLSASWGVELGFGGDGTMGAGSEGKLGLRGATLSRAGSVKRTLRAGTGGGVGLVVGAVEGVAITVRIVVSCLRVAMWLSDKGANGRSREEI
jgi:hypothetical protein